ncbi:MAG: aminoglycoside phosphotransferase family protein [Chloroflexi bacterium]|nr:aminoglycoside phosphotransferase family protein [Chloroflexota bacterium]
MDKVQAYILEKYQVSPNDWLGRGMEAEVYNYRSHAVLKMYAGTAGLTDLFTLKEFYDSLDRHLVPYALPSIYTVAQEENIVITIEKRLVGKPLLRNMSLRTVGELDVIMQRYIAALLALSHVQAPSTFDRYKLFDPDKISDCAKGDWHQFLAHFLNHKLVQVASFLSRDVPQFVAKVQLLQSLLQSPYLGEYRLVHGDFCPGNLLINEKNDVVALLDFGLLTMYGDYLFDIATGWVFFDMYDELKMKARERYLAMLLNQIGTDKRGMLFRYVLIYSILSANSYSSDCSDGHYKWCVDNLRNEHYWGNIE